MALHDVSVEPAISGEATLQVYAATRLPSTKVSFLQRFINGRHGVRARCSIYSHYRQTDSVVGHTLINLQFMGKRGRHGEVAIGALCLHVGDNTERFYNSSEHREMC
jgi:hypothetical protein